MSLLKLLRRNLFRHKFRATLTISAVGISVAVFDILLSLVKQPYANVAALPANRLLVRNKTCIFQLLPVTYKSQICCLPDVKDAV